MKTKNITTSRSTNSINRSPLPRTFFLISVLLGCCFASAAAITVTNNNDNGPGSLRQAISDSLPGDTIDFDSSLNGQTILLTTGELLIDKSLTIAGPGANLLAVDGTHASRVVNIGPGFEVTISGLTIVNGFSPDFGGGILNGGSLTIASTTLSGNGAYDGGGGIYNNGGSVRVRSTTLAGNLATNGGGIYNAAGSLTIANSTLSGNSCINAGGGIANDSGAVTIANSTFSGNSADVGGGILNFDALTMVLGNTILNAGTQGENIVNLGTGIVTSFGYNMSSDPGGGSLYAVGDRINTNPQLNFLADNGGPTFTHALYRHRRIRGTNRTDSDANSNTYPYSVGDPDCDSYCRADAYSNPNANSHAYRDTYTYAYPNSDTNTDPYRRSTRRPGG